MKVIRSFICILIVFSCNPQQDKPNTKSAFPNLKLTGYTYTQLTTDFDLLVNSLKEAHTGLYWYCTEKQFDSVVTAQRLLLKDGLHALQFYAIVAPIVAYTKEDHCDISLSEDLKKLLKKKGLFIPLLVINLRQKPFVVNKPYRGYELVAINGIKITDIYDRLFNTFASDGFISTSKYRYLDFRGFSTEYAKVIGQQKINSIQFKNPMTGVIETRTLSSVPYGQLVEMQKAIMKYNHLLHEIKQPARLEFLNNQTAVLTFRTFGNSDFKEFGMNFKRFVDSAFIQILKNKSMHLIIDVRDNGGGSEGNEDYLFSYLASHPYTKYKHVELSDFSFSFINYTDYSKPEDKRQLEEELRSENEKNKDGKIYRKSGLYAPEPLKKNYFDGKVYVLTSGWTYSGGAEFSSLVKEHTDAVFIGEETGGGYAGNTSGTVLELTLPATRLKIDIPILKFVLDVKKGVFGRGVIPHYIVEPTFEEFMNGHDAVLEFTKERIKN